MSSGVVVGDAGRSASVVGAGVSEGGGCCVDDVVVGT